MIKLSNGRILKYVVASGALGFDGLGWFWERLLVRFRYIKPELFTVVLKTLTLNPRKGNLRWWNPFTWLPWSPWSCIRFIPGGAVNKVGLTNPGFNWWLWEIAPTIDFEKYPVIVSISGSKEELVEMAGWLNHFDLVALEVNPSCPNAGFFSVDAERIIDDIKAVKCVSHHPIIVKFGVHQQCLTIAHGLKGIAEAIDLNSVLWEIAFPGEISPLSRLQQKVGGGGGGVSGEPAQQLNWKTAQVLIKQRALPVIMPDIMDKKDVLHAWMLGAGAVSFGTIHLPDSKWKWWRIFTNPCKPTKIVEELEK